MDERPFLDAVRALFEEQGGTAFVAATLAEFKVQYVNDVPARARGFFLGRARALFEESK